uniref:Uncharacterized protein n=1 Tax=Arundo donax TaxID=35708 RepID=A0A0A9ETG7_ARUDO
MLLARLNIWCFAQHLLGKFQVTI